ncbi:MAG: hypothetical protein NT166_21620 [Candidatus Aminicenantes bacterium]|nr:hypothetical protein [Candidatus Aminicenantes bacterium]
MPGKILQNIRAILVAYTQFDKRLRPARRLIFIWRECYLQRRRKRFRVMKNGIFQTGWDFFRKKVHAAAFYGVFNQKKSLPPLFADLLD